MSIFFNLRRFLAFFEVRASEAEQSFEMRDSYGTESRIQKYAAANKIDRPTDRMAYTGLDGFVNAICHLQR